MGTFVYSDASDDRPPWFADVTADGVGGPLNFVIDFYLYVYN